MTAAGGKEGCTESGGVVDPPSGGVLALYGTGDAAKAAAAGACVAPGLCEEVLYPLGPVVGVVCWLLCCDRERRSRFEDERFAEDLEPPSYCFAELEVW